MALLKCALVTICAPLIAAEGCERQPAAPPNASSATNQPAPGPSVVDSEESASNDDPTIMRETGVAPETPLQTAGKIVNSNDGAFAVKYLFDPAPPPMNEPFSVTVYIGALDGPQPEDVSLSVDAAMPEHGHGMNVEPTIRPLPGNAFAVENMLFHMAGRWEIYFDITRDGVTSRAQDELTLE